MVNDPQNPAPDRRRQLWLVPGEGRTGRGPVADVAVAVRVPALLSYGVPEELREQVRPGVWLRVPYGRRLVTGVCVRVGPRDWKHTQRLVAEVLGAGPVLPPALIELGLWVGEYYACPPGVALAALVPATARRAPQRRVAYLHRTPAAAGIATAGGAPPDVQTLTPKQRAVLDVLAAGPQPRRAALAAAGAGPGVLRKLLELGLVELAAGAEPPSLPSAAVKPAPDEPAPSAAEAARVAECPEDAFTLTPGQQDALEVLSATLAAPSFGVFLLFGVPGSGKTEVYVRAIRQTLPAGRQAILLVPEIALATQIVQRLARRFPRVAILHGQLTPRSRRETLRAIAAGAVDVIIGTRTAVFAPCPRLGLIVVDEEQDHSFKSLSAPYYHARDVAIKRAQLEQIPVLLGSATPALETWHNVQTLPHYRLLRLPERVGGAALPTVRLVATRAPQLGQATVVLSPELHAALDATLAAGQQAILLHNRRGYAVHLRCARCGLFVPCPRCDARLVYHQPQAEVRCHRCGTRQPAPTLCLDVTCGGPLQRIGLAIQRLEEELTRAFPAARLLRLDRDTMRRRADYADALHRFESGGADILLGTQMVAKGLDFPRVRLVGVVDADFALGLPDFRAAEFVFQLVMQVVGRAGRREGGSLALVQSSDVKAPAIRHAIALDYEAFARHELSVRHRFGYPPLSRLVRLVLADARPGRAGGEADRLQAELAALAGRVHPQIVVPEAGPCAIPRLRRMNRYEVLVRGPRDGVLQKLLRQASDEKLLSPRVQRFSIDVDPVDLL